MNQKLQAQVKAANEEISRMCQPGTKWRMCIPVQKDDSDIVLHDTLDALVAEIKRLETERTVVHNYTINYPAPLPDPQATAFVKDFNHLYSVPKVSANDAAGMLATMSVLGFNTADAQDLADAITAIVPRD